MDFPPFSICKILCRVHDDGKCLVVDRRAVRDLYLNFDHEESIVRMDARWRQETGNGQKRDIKSVHKLVEWTSSDILFHDW